MRFKLAAALIAAALATPAYAQDQTGNFNGFNLMIIGGVDNASVDSEEDTSGAYGVSAGYDVDTGNVIVGIEGEATESELHDCVGVNCLVGGRDLYAGGRIGFRVAPTAIVYVKGGYSNARVDLETAGVTVTSDDLDGIRGGVGVEYNGGGIFTVRLEARYSNYEADFSRRQLMLGVGLRF